jgi:peroxiredoxin
MSYVVRRFAVWDGIAISLLVAAFARAEFTAGAVLPEFSLNSADGSAFSLTKEHDKILVTLEGTTLAPKILVVHLFQPDCLQCQAQLQALEELRRSFTSQEVLIIGVAHRGDRTAVLAIERQLKVTVPLLLGTGSALAKQFAAGDTMAIADSRGVVRFAQVGYGQGDEKTWRENIELLVAGKPPKSATIPRESLGVGDRLPAIELPSLISGKPLALTGEGGRLTYRDETGRLLHPKAAIGMFSRYCEFSSEEMGYLQKLYLQYSKDGLLAFAIGMHPSPEKARELTRQLGVTYPVFNGYGSELGKHYAYG